MYIQRNLIGASAFYWTYTGLPYHQMCYNEPCKGVIASLVEVL